MTPKTKELRLTFWMIFTAFLLLFIIGTVNIFSSTFIEDMAEGGSAYGHLIRHVLCFVIGMIPATIVYRSDYRLWKKIAWLAIIFSALLLVAVLGAGIVVNGAKRWLGVGGFTFQPSEVAKLAVILFTAKYLAPLLEKHKPITFFGPWDSSPQAPAWKRFHWLPQPVLLPALVLAGLVIKQPDAGTAIVIMFLPFAMLWISGASLKQAVIPLGVFLVAAAAYTLSAPYRMDRLRAWYDPSSYAQTLGYQTMQGFIAIGSGGIMGQGIGEGISKFSYLPEAHTDFAFAILAQEWGLRGSIVMLVLFCILIFFGFQCAWNTHDKFGELLAAGITLYFGGQGLINLAMVCGLFPVVGVPLPFISYGGTSLIVNLIAAALLLNIARRNYKTAVMAARLRMQPHVQSMKKETRSHFQLH